MGKKQELVKYNISRRSDTGGFHEAVEGRPMGPFLAIRDGDRDMYTIDHIPSGAYLARFEKLQSARAVAKAFMEDDPEGRRIALLVDSQRPALPTVLLKAFDYMNYVRVCELEKAPLLSYADYKALTAYDK